MKPRTLRVIELRRKGLTYTEISREVGLCKGTISYICSRHLGIVERNAITSKNSAASALNSLSAMRLGAQKFYADRKRERVAHWTNKLSALPVEEVSYIAGLYDGEGDKNHHGYFALTNSNKALVLIFISFLGKIGASYRLELYLPNTLNEQEALEFWGFSDIKVRRLDTRPKKRLVYVRKYHGVIRVIVSSPLGLLESLSKYGYYAPN